MLQHLITISDSTLTCPEVAHDIAVVQLQQHGHFCLQGSHMLSHTALKGLILCESHL